MPNEPGPRQVQKNWIHQRIIRPFIKKTTVVGALHELDAANASHERSRNDVPDESGPHQDPRHG